MAEYIERFELLKKIDDELYLQQSTRSYLKMLVRKQPAADVVEVRHGHWVLEKEPNGKPYCFHCSVCDDDFHHIGIKTATDYCPNCGAKMDGKDGTDRGN